MVGQQTGTAKTKFFNLFIVNGKLELFFARSLGVCVCAFTGASAWHFLPFHFAFVSFRVRLLLMELFE